MGEIQTECSQSGCSIIMAVYTEEERELLAAALGMRLNRTFVLSFFPQVYASMMEIEAAEPSFLMLGTT